MIFSTYFGGSSYDQAYALALDSSGNAYVTGQTGSSDFVRTASPVQSLLRGTNDASVTKFSAGGALLYSTFLGGDGGGVEVGYSIAVDSSGQMYVTGATGSTTFPTQSASQLNNGGNVDAFVTKINASGTALLYSTYLGGKHLTRDMELQWMLPATRMLQAWQPRLTSFNRRRRKEHQ